MLPNASAAGGEDKGSNGTVVKDGYRAALGKLHAAQKSSVGAPAYSRFVNRPLGRRFAALAYVAGLTPNGVTLLSALCTFTAPVLVALVPPAWWLGLLVSALLILGYALDAADGQLARLRGGGSLQGEWLDHTVDAAKLSALHLAVLIAAFRFFDVPTTWLLVPIAYLLIDNVLFFSMILKDLLAAQHDGGAGATGANRSTSRLRALLLIPSDYGLFCLIFLLIGLPWLFFAVYAALFICNAVFLVLALTKWYRFMGTLRR